MFTRQVPVWGQAHLAAARPISWRGVLVSRSLTMATLLVAGAMPSTDRELSSYNAVRASRMVQLSGIAYCCGTLGHGVDMWDCHTCKEFPDVQATSFSAKGFSDQNGFVSYDPHDGAGSINVVFTGTDPLKIKEWSAQRCSHFCCWSNSY